MRAVFAVAILGLASPTLAAEIPARFHGVWNMTSAETRSCSATDWTDSSLKIDAKSVKAWESGCDVRRATTRRIPAGYQKTADGVTSLRLSCSGEGQNWTGEELWDIKVMGDQSILVTTSLGKNAAIATYVRCQ